MINEIAVKSYLQNLVNNNEILDFSLTGLQENSAEAIIKRNIFGEVSEDYILIYPYLESYKYSIIINKDQLPNLEDNLDNKISNLEKVINDIILLVVESLPKNEEDTEYKTDKTNLILNAWKNIIKKYPNNINPKIIDGFNNLYNPDNELDESQKRNKWDLENWMNKLNARNRIEVEVGDTLDQITDISKRLSMVERAMMRLFLHVTEDYEMSSEIKEAYTSYMLPIVQAADNDIPIDRTDLEDPTEIINTLMEKNQKIVQIVKEEYLDKMK